MKLPNATTLAWLAGRAYNRKHYGERTHGEIVTAANLLAIRAVRGRAPTEDLDLIDVSCDSSQISLSAGGVTMSIEVKERESVLFAPWDGTYDRIGS